MDAECERKGLCPLGARLQIWQYEASAHIPECVKLSSLGPSGLCALWTFVYIVLRLYAKNDQLAPITINQYLVDWVAHDPAGLCQFAGNMAATLIRDNR